ncbi:MAG: hypothetical protein ACD_76C00067G0005 [uncultured bacterium]|nr:MAG: hypothetical protein ACD_76C00067G0005 [uncultured bacterium]
MKKTKNCKACGPVQVSHTACFFAVIFEIAFAPLMKPLDALAYATRIVASPLRLERTVPAIAKALVFLRLAKIVRDPKLAATWRGRVLWEEALKRKIDMYELRLFGLAREFYIVRFGKITLAFNGLPRPLGAQAKSLEWMDNKGIMKRKFRKMGFPVALGGTALTARRAKKIFSSLKSPVVVKPSIGSRSVHVSSGLKTEKEMLNAFFIARQVSPWVEIEEELEGSVYRATVIGGKLVAVLRRDPPQVTGDGKSSIRDLVAKENKNPARHSEQFHEIELSKEINEYLQSRGLGVDSVLSAGESVALDWRVGRGSGATNTDVTGETHKENRELFENATRYLNDSVVGYDFIIEDISKSWKNTKRCGIIECNSLPFIDLHHFPFQGQPKNIAGDLWNIIFPGSARK